ncbi:MAG: hypothetical protein L0Y72_01985 [Gemmataceae bacterium]|nr:hypothetical protein [Gemmataceae bacterium]MCI0737786.1 hypothetical protein [Gemmataceae bacterium]
MFAYIRQRFLYFATLAIALTLAAAVVLAPLWPDGNIPALVSVFARDAIVRQTALASSVGLAVTAFVFFRPAGFLRLKKNKSEPPIPTAGA